MTRLVGNPPPHLALLYSRPRRSLRGASHRSLPPARHRPLRGPMPTFWRATHPEILLHSFERLKRENGQAPGVDGLRYDALSTTEAAQCLRILSQVIDAGTYVPQPTRSVRIPKRGGTRELRLPTILDRVVAAAVADELEPLCEDIFSPMSFGFRPRRNAWQMLLAMTAYMRRHDLWVVTQDDIAQAYDHVPIDPLLGVVRGYVSDGRLANLVDTIVRGARRQQCRIGIHQGCPLSPTMLNLYLHECLDRPLVAAGPTHPLLYRYADNLAWSTESETDGRAVRQQIAARLATCGLRLKGADGTSTDLRRRGSKIHLLGFSLRRQDDQVVIDLDSRYRSKLRSALIEAQAQPNPAQATRDAITGWIAAYTPAITSESVGPLMDDIYAVATRLGLYELGTRTVYQTHLEQAAQTGSALRQVADGIPATGDYMEICRYVVDHTLRVCISVSDGGRIVAAGGYAAAG